MNLENLKIGIRDFITFAGLIVTIMVNFYTLRNDIRDISKDTSNADKILEIRLNMLEIDVKHLKEQYERQQYQNISNNDNESSKPKRGR